MKIQDVVKDRGFLVVQGDAAHIPLPDNSVQTCVTSPPYWGLRDCDTGTEPQLVLDPFCGAGTTGVVSTQLQRRFVGVDLSREYCEMARDRIREESRAAVEDRVV